MAITVNTKSYVADVAPNANTMIYRGPAATFGSKDSILLARTAPKATATFPGMARARIKLVKTVEYETGKFADAILEIFASVPVGTTEAAIDSLRDDAGDLLISSVANDLIYQHVLQF